MEAKTLTVLEHTHIHEMQSELNRKLQESNKKDLGGKGDHLRRSVLAMVVAEGYDNAKSRLTDYVGEKDEFPAFQERAERYVQHCSELISAIQMKRNFPGLASLSLSRQQEIHEKVMEHFEELKHNLKQIERIERDHKLVDIRSTVWVVKSFSLWVGLIVFAAFVIDLQAGVLSSLIFSMNLWASEISTWFVNLIM